jgi:peptidoglycan hydrolase-like protein with peptidoglycan-binding domain
MNKLVLAIFVTLVFNFAVFCQAPSSTQTAATASKSASDEKPKKQIFRANKDQITQVQKMLKEKGMYAGEATGKLDDPTRESIKTYQKGNGLKETGTLNRATLEKMGIVLTDNQKAIPVSDNSFASSDTAKSSAKEAKPRSPIFRATKDQVIEAQKMLKAKGLYTGEQSGKLDDATRDALKKFQEANGVKITGTLNQATLEKMGIPLTDKQKSGTPESTK